jgi:hypothetical protein
MDTITKFELHQSGGNPLELIINKARFVHYSFREPKGYYDHTHFSHILFLVGYEWHILVYKLKIVVLCTLFFAIS